MRRAVVSFLAILALTLAVAASRGGDLPRPRQAAQRLQPASPTVDHGAELLKAQAVVEYGTALQRVEVGGYIVARAFDEWLAGLPAPSVAVESVLPRAPAAEVHGGHSDAWWMGVAQCEQGGRNDPYFGYFSFMDGSQGGRPWADQVAAGNALLASQASESPAWAPSCVAAGYAASPGG